MGLEKDPSGKDPHEPGAKLDANKRKVASMFLAYFPKAIEEVTKVSEYGAEKYTKDGWRSVDNGIERYTDALVRHLMADICGEVYDPDTQDQIRHASQVAWNALARLELLLQVPFTSIYMGMAHATNRQR